MLRIGLLICVCLFSLGCALLFAFGSAGSPCFRSRWQCELCEDDQCSFGTGPWPDAQFRSTRSAVRIFRIDEVVGGVMSGVVLHKMRDVPVSTCAVLLGAKNMESWFPDQR